MEDTEEKMFENNCDPLVRVFPQVKGSTFTVGDSPGGGGETEEQWLHNAVD